MRNGVCLALCAGSLLLFWRPLTDLLQLSLADSRYSHVAFVPFIAAALLGLEQTRIFRDLAWRPAPGIALLASAVLLRLAAPRSALPALVLALVLAWTGAFLLCYGARALRSARFAFLFLLLMVPLPPAIVGKVSFALQAASAEISHLLFRLAGVPVFRQGFLFSLPNIGIEISEQCSGIRSTIAIVVATLLLAHLFLRSASRKLALVAFALLAAVFKNAVRIVFLASAGTYFDADLMGSGLHHSYGGAVFSALALGLIVPALLWLRRQEQKLESFRCRTTEQPR